MKGGTLAAESLRGKNALITGAAGRIGQEITLTLADEDVNIVIHYRTSAKEADELCSSICPRGVKARSVKADFNIPEKYESLIPRAKQSVGSLDILINSASVFFPGTIQEVDFRSLMENMQVNDCTPFVLSRHLAKSTGRGKIINLLDTRLYGYDWSHVAYILSKQVLSVLTRMIALELALHISVNAVAPGLILLPPGRITPTWISR